jgi:hypothetical protein
MIKKYTLGISGLELLDEIFEDLLQPLPFGHVHKGVVKSDGYHFFQVEIPNPSSIVTIEVTCKKGTANVYSSKQNIPIESEHQYKASCGIVNEPTTNKKSPTNSFATIINMDLNKNSSMRSSGEFIMSKMNSTINNFNDSNVNMVPLQPSCRLIIKPDDDFKDHSSEKSCSLIVSVHGGLAGATFSIWAFATAEEISSKSYISSEALATIAGLKSLSDYNSVEELSMILNPELNIIPNQKKKLKGAITSVSNVQDISEVIPSSLSGVSSSSNELSDLINSSSRQLQRRSLTVNDSEEFLLDNMVSKHGRHIMKSSKSCKPDPNYHKDLFEIPQIPIAPSPINSGRDDNKGTSEIMNSAMKTLSRVDSTIDNNISFDNIPLKDQIRFYDESMEIITGQSFKNTSKYQSKMSKVSKKIQKSSSLPILKYPVNKKGLQLTSSINRDNNILSDTFYKKGSLPVI